MLSQTAHIIGGIDGDLIVALIVFLVWAFRAVAKLSDNKEAERRRRINQQARDPSASQPQRQPRPQFNPLAFPTQIARPGLRPPPPRPVPPQQFDPFAFPTQSAPPPQRRPLPPPIPARPRPAMQLAQPPRRPPPPRRPAPPPPRAADSAAVVELVARPLPSDRGRLETGPAMQSHAQAAGPSLAISAAAVARWMKPTTLHSQFLLTEIFQPPLALRDRPI